MLKVVVAPDNLPSRDGIMVKGEGGDGGRGDGEGCGRVGLGDGHGEGEGEGVGAGLGVGVGEGLGDGEGDGVGEGLGDGEGAGAGTGDGTGTGEGDGGGRGPDVNPMTSPPVVYAPMVTEAPVEIPPTLPALRRGEEDCRWKAEGEGVPVRGPMKRGSEVREERSKPRACHWGRDSVKAAGSNRAWGPAIP